MEPYVCWRPRKWNTLADFVANVIATHQSPVNIVREDFEELLSSEQTLIQIHSDGSVYTDGRGAFCYTIIALQKHQEMIRRTILAVVGEPLNHQNISTFLVPYFQS